MCVCAWLHTHSYAHTTVSFCMLSAYSACHSSSAVSDASLQSGRMLLPKASVIMQQFMWMPNSLRKRQRPVRKVRVSAVHVYDQGYGASQLQPGTYMLTTTLHDTVSGPLEAARLIPQAHRKSPGEFRLSMQTHMCFTMARALTRTVKMVPSHPISCASHALCSASTDERWPCSRVPRPAADLAGQSAPGFLRQPAEAGEVWVLHAHDL